MSNQTRTVEFLSIRALVNANSIDKDKRTVEVVFATDTPVKRGYYDPYYEVLSLDPAHIRMERITNGAGPVLDSHRSFGIGAQIGVVESARVENGKGIAVLRFSKRDEVEKIFADMQDGIIKNVSVGYQVHAYTRTKTKSETQLEELTATDWEPFEISLVPIPADHNSTVRSHEHRSEVKIIDSNSNSNKMTEEQKAALAAERKRVSEIHNMVRTANLPASFGENLINEDKTVDQARAAVDAEVKRLKDNPSAEDVLKAERQRATEINQAVRMAGLPATDAEKYIAEGKTADEVRKLVIESWAQADPTKGMRNGVSVGKEDSEKKREVMEEALVLRSGGGELTVDKLTARGMAADNAKGLITAVREYRSMSLLRLAEEVIVLNGGSVRGKTNREIAEIALGLRDGGLHSTSDFPLILGNTVNRRLRAFYELAPRTFMPFCRRNDSKDFREKAAVQLSGLTSAFAEVKEGGEYKANSLTEGQEKYRLKKYGTIIGITWETIINDDLGAFNRLPQIIAEEAAQMQSDIVWGIITDNAALADSVALFHADHGNLAGSGTAITVDAVSAGRAAMRKQTGIDGRRVLNLQPEFLLCGPDKETEAQKLLQAVIVATKTSDTNVFKGSMQHIVEPRLTGNQWYLSAAPTRVDTIEYGFLEGEGELFTEQRVGFDVDGMQMKARMVFAAKAIDHRGMYKNAGA